MAMAQVDRKAIGCLVGSVLINITLGTLYSIGNLTPYVTSYMQAHVDPSITKGYMIYITSTFLLGQGVFLVLGARIERAYNARVACIIGCLIHTACCFLAVWAFKRSFFLLVLIYGVGTGCGAGLAYVATIVAIQRWFPMSKGLFTGVILTGFGVGGLAYTKLQTWYINPDNKTQDKAGLFGPDVYEGLPGLFYFMGFTFMLLQTIGCCLIFPPPIVADNQQGANGAQIQQESALPNIQQTSDLWNYRIFFVIGSMMALSVPGMTFMNTMGKSYGQTFIKDDSFLSTVTAFASVANAAGRLFYGFLMDRFRFSTCLVWKSAIFTSLLITFSFRIVLETRFLYFFWMLGLFFNFAGVFVVFPVFIDQVFGSKFSGMAYGILYNFLSVSSVICSFGITWLLKAAPRKNDPNYDPKQEPVSSRIGPPFAITILYWLGVGLYFFLVSVNQVEDAIERRREVMRQLHHQQLNGTTVTTAALPGPPTPVAVSSPAAGPQKSQSKASPSMAALAAAGGKSAIATSGAPKSTSARSRPQVPRSQSAKNKPRSQVGPTGAASTTIDDNRTSGTASSAASSASSVAASGGGSSVLPPPPGPMPIKQTSSAKSVIPPTAATKSELSQLEGKNSLGTMVFLKGSSSRDIKKLPA